MPRLFSIVLLVAGIASLACAYAAPSENATLVSSTSYASDDKWWNCPPPTYDKCMSGPLDRLGLSKEEVAYVRNTLDVIPWYPNKATPEGVAKILGSPGGPMMVVMKQYFGVGPGTYAQRGLSVYYMNGYVSMIHYLASERVFLTRSLSVDAFKK